MTELGHQEVQRRWKISQLWSDLNVEDKKISTFFFSQSKQIYTNFKTSKFQRTHQRDINSFFQERRFLIYFYSSCNFSVIPTTISLLSSLKVTGLKTVMLLSFCLITFGSDLLFNRGDTISPQTLKLCQKNSFFCFF